jgi:hypothetical protein
MKKELIKGNFNEFVELILSLLKQHNLDLSCMDDIIIKRGEGDFYDLVGLSKNLAKNAIEVRLYDRWDRERFVISEVDMYYSKLIKSCEILVGGATEDEADYVCAFQLTE